MNRNIIILILVITFFIISLFLTLFKNSPKELISEKISIRWEDDGRKKTLKVYGGFPHKEKRYLAIMLTLFFMVILFFFEEPILHLLMKLPFLILKDRDASLAASIIFINIVLLFVMGSYSIKESVLQSQFYNLSQSEKEDKVAELVEGKSTIPKFVEKLLAYEIRNYDVFDDGGGIERKKIGYVRKDEWNLVYKFTKAFGTIYAIILLILFILVYVFTTNQDNQMLKSVVSSLPRYPVFLMLLVTIFKFYLEGFTFVLSDADDNKNSEKTVEVDKQFGNFKELYDDYLMVWKNNALAYHKTSDVEVKAKDDASEEKISPETEESIKHLERQNINLDYKYRRLLNEMLKSNDVIISDENYDDLAPILVSFLEKSIIKGKKIILLLEESVYYNSETNKQFNKWLKKCFKDLYNKTTRYIINFEDWKEDKNWDILISTQSELIEYQEQVIKNLDREQNELKDLIILVFNEKTDDLAENIVSLSILTKILNTHFINTNNRETKKAHYIIIANESDNLTSSVNRNLGINASYHLLNTRRSKNNYSIIWRTDSKEKYYYEIANSNPNVAVGNLLSILPWARGFREIDFVENFNDSYKVFGQNIDRMRNTFKDRPINKNTLDVSYASVSKNRPISSLLSTSKKKLIFINDNLKNAPLYVQKYNSIASEENFINIVSNNYLLRDYFIDSIDFFVNNPILGFTPNIEEDEFTVMSYLKEILTNKSLKVTEEDVRRELSKIEKQINDVQSLLVTKFKRVFNIDIIKSNFLEVKSEYIFDLTEKKYKQLYIYSLSSEIKSDKNFKWFNNYQIEDSGRNRYGSITLDHLYQNYLPAQRHSFNGEPFRIERIDHENKRVLIVSNEAAESIEYRNSDSVIIGEITGTFKEKVVSKSLNYTMEQEFFLGNYSVETDGYYTFTNGIKLDSSHKKEEFISSSEYRRDYYNGKILSVKVISESLKVNKDSIDKMSYTLALLLSELFATKFPGNHKYIKILPLVNEDLFPSRLNDYKQYAFEVPEEHQHSLVKRVQVLREGCLTNDKIQPNSENSFTLLFVEDSHRDVGLIKAISEKIEDIVRLLQDYINWFLGENTPKKEWNKTEISKAAKAEFLKFGMDKISENLEIKNLGEFLNHIFDANELTITKERFYSQLTNNADEDEFDREYKYLINQIKKNKANDNSIRENGITR